MEEPQGLSMNRGTGGSFIGTFKGNFVCKCDPKTPGAITRENKEGKTVTELHFNTFTGYVTGIAKKDSSFGLQWAISLFDGKKTWTLNLPWGGGMVKSFFGRLVNVDVTKKILIGIMESKGNDDKMRTFFWMWENLKWDGQKYTGDKVLDFWPRENPNGLPELIKVRRKGKEEYDDTDRMAYIESFLEENVIPRLPKFESDPDAGEGTHDDVGDEPEQKAPPAPKKAELPNWLKGKGATTQTTTAPSPPKPAPSKKGEKLNKPLPDNNPTDDLPF